MSGEWVGEEGIAGIYAFNGGSCGFKIEWDRHGQGWRGTAHLGGGVDHQVAGSGAAPDVLAVIRQLAAQQTKPVPKTVQLDDYRGR